MIIKVVFLEECHLGLGRLNIVLLDHRVALHVAMDVYILDGAVEIMLLLPGLFFLLL